MRTILSTIKINCIVLLFVCSAQTKTWAQFPGAAGTPGSTAIHKDTSIIAAWAANCVINRGWMNIADTTLGKTQVGDETFVPGPAANGVVSLGDGGTATVTFHFPIRNGTGFDFAVFENGFDDRYLELAFVEVSSDGERFVRFPATSLTPSNEQVDPFSYWADATLLHNLAGKYRANFGTPFDLEELKDSVGIDINRITHVRIIDVIGSIDSMYATFDHLGNMINDPWPTPFASGGFDLDAIAVINHLGPPASIREVVSFQIQASPNPVRDQLVVNINTRISQITISDLLGNVLISSFTNYVNTDALKAGYYILKVQDENGAVATKPILKL
jgi:hypothetical protein